MDNTPYGDASEIGAFFAGMRPGDKVLKADLFGLKSLDGLSIPQKRKVISYFEGTGDLVHGEGGAIYYKQAPARPEEYVKPPAREYPAELAFRRTDTTETGRTTSFQEAVAEIHLPDPLREREVPSNENPDYPFISGKIGAKIAYEFFDPNPSIFRGVVVSESGWDYDKDKSRSAGVEVLLPDGHTRFGLVSPRHYDRDRKTDTLQSIADKMREGEFVLVRHTGEFTGNSGKSTLLFEPLIFLYETDNATLNGERIRTVVEDKRILHLPIVEPGRMRDGVLNGVGYIPESYDITPVYVNGAGKMVWNIVPRVDITRKLLTEKGLTWGELLDGKKRTFYIGELPMPPAEKTIKELGKLDPEIEYMEHMRFPPNPERTINGGYGEIGAKRAYIRLLGMLRTAREGGMLREVLKRRDKLRRFMSEALAAEGLDKRDRSVFSELYKPGTEAYKSFMEYWMNGGLEKYLDALQEEGRFRDNGLRWDDSILGYRQATQAEIEENVRQKIQRKKNELADAPLTGVALIRLFDQSAIRDLKNKDPYESKFSDYFQAVRRAFEAAASDVEISFDWHQRFPEDMLNQAPGLVTEGVFWNAVWRFNGLDMQQMWDKLFDGMRDSGMLPPEVELSKRVMQPYIELVKERLR